MLRRLQNLCSFLLATNPGPVSPRRPGISKRVRLTLECLEGRLTPASYGWNGPAGGAWSQPNNWIDTATGQPPQNAPGANDSVTFSGAQNTNSTADIQAVANMTVTAGYTSIISLQAFMGTGRLYISGSLSVAGGTIRGLGTVNILQISNATSTFSWSGGTLRLLQVNLGPLDGSARPSSTISGTAAKNMDTVYMYNSGTVTWTGTGSIAMSNFGGVTNQTGATFDIQSDSSVTGGANNGITNRGTLKKSLGAGTTTVGVKFENVGSFQLNSGTVHFTGETRQTTTAVTTLNGGSLSTNSTYYIGDGLVQGVGTITGNLSTGFPENPTGGTGRVHPGIGSAPGVLNVIGNYTQTAGGTLFIEINAQGTVAVLNVQANQGQGGAATLNGKLRVQNSADYKPEQLGLALTFMTYASVSGDFVTKEFANPFWFGEDGRPYRFEPFQNANNYELVVSADD
jgi:hypothetical protein